MNDKIINPQRNTKIFSSLSILFFLVAIGLSAYLPAGLKNKLGTQDGKTFTISRALANANKASFLVLIIFSGFFIFRLVSIRGPEKYLNLRLGLLIISFSFLISLLWVTVSKNEDLHYFFASIIFASVFLFNMLTYYLYYNKYRKARNDKKFILILAGINIICFISLIVFAILHGQVDTDIFAALEILFSLLFVYILFFIGFY